MGLFLLLIVLNLLYCEIGISCSEITSGPFKKPPVCNRADKGKSPLLAGSLAPTDSRKDKGKGPEVEGPSTQLHEGNTVVQPLQTRVPESEPQEFIPPKPVAVPATIPKKRKPVSPPPSRHAGNEYF